ncbi:winged helix-turn-helix domain-containing protein [Streptomyces sp. NPDC006333]|uniref:ArsR/SmtB family transcription factor n=1 Tax=Streptomyces sp. NPDC006333 TaxID=3156753 RepID=UPI0033B32C60
MQQLIAGGFEKLLEQANPQWMRWKPPVLEIQMMSDVDRDLYLEGQGLVLVPSMFSTRSVVTQGHHPAVSYPVFQGQRTVLGPVVSESMDDKADYDRVSPLLGRTRALVLITIAEHEDCTTKELATRAGIAPASASEHATVLRGAGLVRSLRHRNFVLHGLTPLGLALLHNAERG